MKKFAFLSFVSFVSILLLACQIPGTGPTGPAATYTITYNGNGNTSGSVPVDSTKYTSGQTVTVDSNTGTLAITGDTFSGWNTAANGSGTSYTAGTTLTVGSANVVLYAQWATGTARWAKTVTAGFNGSTFQAIVTDSSGNIYAAGWQYPTETYGSGVSVTGAYNGADVVVVKYNSSGVAQWAQTVDSITTSTNSNSEFLGVAVDSSGNVYAAGWQEGTGTYTYGTGVTAKGVSSSDNAVLVKYNSAGVAQWAETASAGAGESQFLGVAYDPSSGNISAVGWQNGSGAYTYGTGVSPAGVSTSSNAVVVTYSPSGAAQWAQTPSAGSSYTQFNGVAVDSSGNLYAAGYQEGTGSFTYGTGVSATGAYIYANAVVVKYDSTGAAVWAQTTSAATDNSQFNGVAVDSSGNVYAAGYQLGTGSVTYGSGVSAAGAYDNSGTGDNCVVVKYDSSGTALWARSVSAGSSVSEFKGVAVDSSGNVYAAGFQSGSAAFTYGSGVSATGPYTYNNAALVKYNSAGSAQWAQTVSTAPSGTLFYGVTVDSSGNIYAAGTQDSSGTFTYGSGVSATGNGVALVEYGP